MNKLVRIFEREKFIKDCGIDSYKKNKSWVDLCNGRLVNELEQEGFKFLTQWITLKEFKKEVKIDEKQRIRKRRIY